MKRLLYFLFLAFLLSPASRAQGGEEAPSRTPLSPPLSFIPADSVALWTYLGNDVRTLAATAAPGTPAADIGLPSGAGADEAEQLERLWHTYLPHFNAVGGGGDEQADPQGIPSLYAFSLGALLFQLRGEARYADAMERALFNAAPRTLTDTAAGLPAEELRAAAAVVLAAPGAVYAASADGRALYVNLYTNCTARLALQGKRFVLDQITDMPAAGGVKFRFMNLRDTLRLRLRLRMPDWTERRSGTGASWAWAEAKRTPVRIFVNGHELLRSEVDAAGYVEVERAWRSMDEVYIDFPLQPQYVRRTDPATGQAVRGALALQIGPLVYQCSEVKPTWYANATLPFRYTGALTPSGQNIVRGTLFDESAAPQDATAPEVDVRAIPYAEGEPGTVWLREIK